MGKNKIIKKTIVTTEEIIEESNDYTHIICLLDKSGSMGMNNIIVEARNSVNTFIKTQKEKDLGKVTVSIYLFDDTYESLYVMKSLDKIKTLTEDDWKPNGMTRLFDGIGKTINNEEKLISDMKKSDRPDKVLFVITTDGDENNSKEYTSASQIKDMITTKEKDGWKFIYTAAGKDAFSAGTNIGISAGNTLSFASSSKGYASFTTSLNNAATMFRTASVGTANYAAVADSLMSTSNVDDSVVSTDTDDDKK